MSLATNLRNLRTARQLSQETLARKLHVSRQSVSKWENGEAKPEVEKLSAICEILQCDLAELINGEIAKHQISENLKKHYILNAKRFAKLISAAVFFGALAISACLYGLLLIRVERGVLISLIIGFLLLLPAVYCFARSRSERNIYRRMHRTLPTNMFTTDESIAHLKSLKPLLFTSLIALFIAIVGFLIYLVLAPIQNYGIDVLAFLFLLVALVAPPVKYLSIMSSITDIPRYNWQGSEVFRTQRRHRRRIVWVINVVLIAVGGIALGFRAKNLDTIIVCCLIIAFIVNFYHYFLPTQIKIDKQN